jgi:hypothetical protein
MPFYGVPCVTYMNPLVPHPVRQGELDRGRPLVERPELPVVADEPYQRIA